VRLITTPKEKPEEKEKEQKKIIIRKNNLNVLGSNLKFLQK
jgi:hypothetical protein